MRVATILPLRYPQSRTLVMSSLPASWEKYIVSLNKEDGKEYLYGNFDWNLEESEIEEEERWLGFPLKLIGTMYKERLEHKHFVYMANLVRFWREFFKEKKVEVFLGRLEAFPNDMISSRVAKRMNIQFIGIAPKFATYAQLLNEHGDPIFWKDVDKKDIEKGVSFFENRYTEFGIDSKKKVQHLNSDYMGFLNEIHEKLTLSRERRLEATPLTTSAKKPIEGMMKKIVAPYINDKYVENRKYFFFPLHYKYETYLYREFWYLDQYELARQVARSTPHGIDFLFRTHPSLRNSDAEIRKILEIKKIPNAKFVSWKIPSTKLIRKSMGVVGIFSTTLLEAIVLKKPAVVLYSKGYAVEDVNIYVDDMRHLPAAINEIAYNRFKIDLKKRDDFLGKLYKHYIPLEGKFTRYGQIPTKNDCKQTADEIVDYLKAVGKVG